MREEMNSKKYKTNCKSLDYFLTIFSYYKGFGNLKEREKNERKGKETEKERKKGKKDKLVAALPFTTTFSRPSSEHLSPVPICLSPSSKPPALRQGLDFRS